MKYLKILGLVAVAASALTAFTGISSATTLTSPKWTVVGVGEIIHAATPAGTHAVLDSPIGKIECNMTIQGKVTNAGGGAPTQSVEASVEHFSMTGCTGSAVYVPNFGSFKITSSGGGKGVLTATGTEVTIETFGLHCIYSTSGTPMGTVTGGSPASIAISATIPRTGGKSGAFCGSTAPLTGGFVITNPNPAYID